MIRAEDLTVCAGTFRLERIELHIPRGTYCVLMGRTGTGKTTLLETICGLKPPSGGRLLIEGRDAGAMKPGERGIGFVPQDGALFYAMTVRKHLEFALRVRNWSGDEIRRRVDELADLIDVRDLLDRRPAGLSAGEQQRVALGRALSFRPQILCLDEPLSSLDDESRVGLVDLLRRITTETEVTALHVTHNRDDAEHLADLQLQIEGGKILQTSPAIPSPSTSFPS